MKIAILIGLIGLVVSEIPSVTCFNNVLGLDCVDDNSANFTHFWNVTNNCNATDFTCEYVNEKCQSVLDTYQPIDCEAAQNDYNAGGDRRRMSITSLAEDVRRLAYPPINPWNNDQMCTFYDGQINKWGTQFTKYFTWRWCWGWLCQQLPNYGSACHCIIYNGEFWYGQLDLTNYDTPQLTFDYSFVADYKPLTKVEICVDCGYGTKVIDTLEWDNGYLVKNYEFKCAGKTNSWADNYDYFSEYLPTECANNPYVHLKFRLLEYTAGYGKWFGIKNLCMVDSNQPVNKCKGKINPNIDICSLSNCNQCLHENAIHGDLTCKPKIDYGYGVKGCAAGMKWCGDKDYGCGIRDCSVGSCVSNANKDGTCFPKIYNKCYPGTHFCAPYP